MKKETILGQIIRIMGIVFGIDLALIVLVVVIGWWTGWQTQEEFKNAIQLAGIFVIGIGFLGIKGNWGITRNFDHMSNKPAASKSSWEKIQQSLLDFIQSYRFMITMFIAGGVCLVISWSM